MIRIVSAATFEEALFQIRNKFSDNVTIISTLETHCGVTVRFNTPEAFVPEETLENVEQFLIQKHFSPKTRGEILQGVRSGQYGYDASAEALLHKIFMIEKADLRFYMNHNPLILCGFSGVGKTYLTMLYAHLMKAQNLPIHIISCDTMKPGGIQEIKNLAQKPAIPVSIAINPEDVPIMAHNIKRGTVLIVDTPSLHMNDSLSLQFLEKLAQFYQSSLVWVTGSKGGEQDYLQQYRYLQGLPFQGLIMNKIHIQEKISSILEICCKERIPFLQFITSYSLREPDLKGSYKKIPRVA